MLNESFNYKIGTEYLIFAFGRLAGGNTLGRIFIHVFSFRIATRNVEPMGVEDCSNKECDEEE